ncbi:MAG: hypothetical protein OXI37_08555 [Gammaproteobacteria bacterium]|nr:hypothetical protein [Gammaproteobacteria bacterium]
MVAKPLKQALIEADDFEKVIFTSSIDSLTDEDRASIFVCPVIFQRHIPKTVDIRVTVVGNQVFAVTIHSQESEETKVDWRRGSNPRLHHEVVNLSDDVADKCVRIVQSQFLRFGTVDLVWDLDRTGLPIASAITDEMLKLANE